MTIDRNDHVPGTLIQGKGKPSKDCLDCGVELEAGVNWTPGNVRSHKYYCQTCYNKRATRRSRRGGKYITWWGGGKGVEPRQPTVHGAPERRPGRGTLYRPGQSQFRKAVLERDQVCVVSGTPITRTVTSKGRAVSIVQAAHIKPVSMCSDGEYWDPDNGLAMRRDVHAAFDAALFTITELGYVNKFSDAGHPRGDPPPRILVSLSEGQRQYLKLHREWCYRNWNNWGK